MKSVVPGKHRWPFPLQGGIKAGRHTASYPGGREKPRTPCVGGAVSRQKRTAAVRIGGKIAIAAGLALSQVAVAAPPERPNSALVPWFESLKQPGTGAPCCSIADCRTAEFRQDRDGYEVLIDGRWKLSAPFWLRVPPNRIIDRRDNPTGRAVICFTPEAGILCFVRPAES
jgi:hypothetical protein